MEELKTERLYFDIEFNKEQERNNLLEIDVKQ